MFSDLSSVCRLFQFFARGPFLIFIFYFVTPQPFNFKLRASYVLRNITRLRNYVASLYHSLYDHSKYNVFYISLVYKCVDSFCHIKPLAQAYLAIPVAVGDIKGLMILKNTLSCFKPSYRFVQISPQFL